MSTFGYIVGRIVRRIITFKIQTGAHFRQQMTRDSQGNVSPREKEVLLLAVAKGMTDKEIAAVLGISPTTVRTHIARLRAKLGAANRAQLAALAVTRRVIDAP